MSAMLVTILLAAGLAVCAPPAHAVAAEPAPSPGVSPAVAAQPDAADPGAPDSPGGPGGPGFFDFGGRIREAITSWFSELVASTLDAGLGLLGRTVLATPDVSGPGRVRDLWLMSLAITDTAFVLLVLIGGTVVMGHETLQVRHSAKEIAPRVVVAFVAANTSLFIAGQLIRFANALSQALLGQDVGADAVATTIQRLTLGAPITAGPFGFGSMALVLVGVAAAVMLLLLLLVWIIRIALVVVLVAAAPLLLALHALPHTEGMARMWWRSLTACLLVQVAQAFVLVTAVRVFFQPEGAAALFGASAGDALVDMLMVVCLLFLLLRIPVWASRMVFNGRGSAIARTVRYYVVARAVRGVVPS